jgi:hypothetical protein
MRVELAALFHPDRLRPARLCRSCVSHGRSSFPPSSAPTPATPAVDQAGRPDRATRGSGGEGRPDEARLAIGEGRRQTPWHLVPSRLALARPSTSRCSSRRRMERSLGLSSNPPPTTAQLACWWRHSPPRLSSFPTRRPARPLAGSLSRRADLSRVVSSPPTSQERAGQRTNSASRDERPLSSLHNKQMVDAP